MNGRTRKYQRYVAAQCEANTRKLHLVWAMEENIGFLSGYLRGRIRQPKLGLCHGTRGGQEQAWFRKYLMGCEVLGTEISPTAEQFPHTIQWDFHLPRPEWTGRADFVYSNALDHAHDPHRALQVWAESLQPNGLCIIEHTSGHSAGASAIDPFKAPQAKLLGYIADWGAGRYELHETLRAPVLRAGESAAAFIILKRIAA